MRNWIMPIFATIGMVIGIFLYGKNRGKVDQIATQNSKVLEDVEKDVKARRDSSTLTTDEQLSELHDRVQK